MCLTFKGRIHTRLAMLVGPFVLAWFFATMRNRSDYWLLFGLMFGVGILLEITVYGWLIGYQARWLTIVLAIIEFFILKWIVEWPYPLEIRLRTRQALELYSAGWLLSWLTLHVVLPVLWSRWAEDGGEFRPLVARIRQRLLPTSLATRRRIYAWSAMLVGVVALPWCIAAWRVPEGHHFTGLLMMEPGHIAALAQASAAAQTGEITSLSACIGWIASTFRWSVLHSYFLVWGISACFWFVGLHLCFQDTPACPLRVIALGGLPLLLLPAPWLLVAALLAWGVALLPWRLPYLPKYERLILPPLALAVLLVWGGVWLRLPSTSLAYVDEGTWQAAIWLNQRIPASRAETVAAPPHMQKVIAALSGIPVIDEGTPASLYLVAGAECEAPGSVFQHGHLCIRDAMFTHVGTKEVRQDNEQRDTFFAFHPLVLQTR